MPPRGDEVLDTEEAGGLVVRGAVVRVAGFGAGLAASLVAAILLTRHLGVEQYGRYQIVVSLITVVGAVTDLGMATLGTREYVQRAGPERDALMRTILGMRVGLTAAGVLVAAGVAAAAGYESALIAGTLLFGAGLVLTVFQTTLQIPLGVALRVGTLTALDVARSVLTALGIAGLVLAGAGIVPFLAVPLPVMVALTIGTAALVRGRIPMRPTFRLGEWAKLARIAIVFSLATAVGTIYTYLAQILTEFVTTAEEVGLFAASFRVYIIAAAVPGLLVSTAFPLLSRAAQDNRARLESAIQGLFDGTALLGCAVALGVVVGAPTLIDIVGGSDYEGAAEVLRFHGAAMLASFLLAPLSFALLALHRHRGMLAANAVALLVTTVLVLALGSSDGARGAAIATVIGEVVLLAGYAVALTAGDRELRPSMATTAKALACAGLAALVVLVPGLGPLPAAVIAVAAYAVLVLLARAVPADLLVLLPPWLRSRLPGGWR